MTNNEQIDQFILVLFLIATLLTIAVVVKYEVEKLINKEK